MPDGKTQDMDVAAEAPAYTPAMTHSPANVGTTRIDALLVEFKAKAALIALGPSDVKVAVEGQPARTHWQKGDVLFIGRSVKHEAQNTGGKPVDFVIVGIK
jgi:hypothetical protein